MRAVDVITKKRDGHELSRSEIESFLSQYLDGRIADYQVSALLMAIFLNGMSFSETAALTDVMMHSGDVYDLDALGIGFTVDKHSTGGVGDKTSLILAPLVAACGVAVPMVSGRGLGHTGGTLDKLESIPGFSVNLGRDQFYSQLQSIGVAMIGQTQSFVPADKKLYALRDVTATVESIPLISASIMSKKVASGAHALVMDVKVGSGAFMSTMERARELAKTLIEVGGQMDRPVTVLLTDMNQPLGRKVGNALEVQECWDVLNGKGPDDTRALSLELAAEMLLLSKKYGSLEEAQNAAEEGLDSGRARSRFLEMVSAQGGDVSVFENQDGFNIPKNVAVLESPVSGYVSFIDCRDIGTAALILGAGRNRTDDIIDHGVGLEINVRLGDRVTKGQPLVTIYHRDGCGLESARQELEAAVTVTENDVQPPALIYDRMRPS